VGSTFSNDGDVSGNHGEEDGWVVMLDKSGNIEWQKTLGGSGTERFQGVTQTLAGDYVLVGSTNSTDGDVNENKGISDAWVVKIDKKGNLQWQKTFGGTSDEMLLDVTQTLDGDFLMAGSSGRNRSGDLVLMN
jgi:predicted transcriptional regulator